MTQENTQADAPNVNVTPSSQAQTATMSTEEVAAAQKAEAEGALLAGKFKTPQDLEKAYKELEQKLGQKPQQPAEEEPKTEEATPEGDEGKTEETETDDKDYGPYGKAVATALETAGVKAEDAAKEFEETGTFSDDTFKKFEDAGFPREIVEAYVRGLSQSNSEVTEVTAAQIGQIKAVAGGDEGYGKLQQWMAANLSEDDLNAYNETMGKGDFNAIITAVTEMNTRYLKEVGKEGKVLGGRAAGETPGFASEAEYLEAMADPRYKKSQAYRDEVAAKLMRSPNVMQVR